jgi:hypothetical protein
MNAAAEKQAENALEFLRIAMDIELGPKFDEDVRARPLTKDENEVKDAALTSLLQYFVSDPEKTGTRSGSEPKRKKRRAKQEA